LKESNNLHENNPVGLLDLLFTLNDTPQIDEPSDKKVVISTGVVPMPITADTEVVSASLMVLAKILSVKFPDVIVKSVDI
jgi:hypothetical protein